LPVFLRREQTLPLLAWQAADGEIVEGVPSAPAAGLAMVEGSIPAAGHPAVFAQGMLGQELPQLGQAVVQFGAVLPGPRPLVM
jgi:hypothetical protein